MKREPDAQTPHNLTTPARAGASRRFSLALLSAACVFFLFHAWPGASAEASTQVSRLQFVRAAFALPAAAQGGNFSTFSHSLPAHSGLACASCHQRSNNSPQPALPGHKSCTSCHFQQFVTAGQPICAICHTNVESANPPVKGFPSLKSFNVRFDHAQHTTGAGRPEAGCASCHAPARRGVALTIPAGLQAHQNCYQCHTPGAQSGGRDISSCGACHAQGGYRRTSTGSRAFAVSFSHATHGPRQGLSCAECHSVRAGAPQSRQVTSPRPTQHFASGRAQSCMTCHNNRRAFGGDDFADCKRCHKGPTFRF
ncbi:MAG TPA: cytochrome c3 family protein [Pyrinomonadaceae bacterium]|nr:cytochrome c3 family protein [Pyrinomonadaceae bacterium]